MKSIIQKISNIGLVPVVKIDKIETTLPLVQALKDGGLNCVEITFRTDAAQAAIELISKKMPEILVGAGTVLTTEQVDKAVAAGAKFIVSPGLNPKVVKYCLEKNIAIIPGTANASDIEQAIELGLDVVKFFPAETNGGVKAIKALAGPFPNMKFMATGGINEKNILEYLSFEKVIACGGSWMVDSALVNAGNYEKIQSLTKEALDKILGFEIAHIGINSSNESEAKNTAKGFENLFAFEVKEGSSSIFAGKGIEIMKSPFLGKQGHIAIKTNSIKIAKAYLEEKGVKFKAETEKVDEKGNLKAIYLENELGGFAIHLLQK